MKFFAFNILIVSILLIVGCRAPQHIKPISEPSADPKVRNFQATWDSCRQTLKKYGYQIDRLDKRDGVITTYATPGGQFFEFWRKDAATTFNWRENTLHTILRSARVTITPRPNSNSYDFKVEIAMARSDKNQLITSEVGDEQKATEGGVMDKVYRYGEGNPMTRLTFNDLLKAPDKKYLERRAKPRSDRNPASMIVPLGMDHDLEAKITESIQKAINTYDHRKAGAWVTF